MTNGVYLTPTGGIYTATASGGASDSTLTVDAPAVTALTTLGAISRAAAVAEATGKGAITELKKSENMNH